MNIQDWFPLGWTDWIPLQSKGLSRVFSKTTVQKHQFFGFWRIWCLKNYYNMYPFLGGWFYDFFYFWDIFISNCWLFFYPLQIRCMIFLLPSSHFSSLFSHFSYGLLLPLPLLISSFSSFSTSSAFSSSLSLFPWKRNCTRSVYIAMERLC